MDSFALSRRTAARIASAVHRCISVCADAEKGYALAGGAAHDPSLRALFERGSAERVGFATVLRELLVQIGEPPDGQGTTLGALHRAAVDMRLAAFGASDLVLLQECDRGEREAQRVYEAARSELVHMAAPKPIRDAVDAQYAAVCNARFEIDQRIVALAPPSAPRSLR
jgi:uncharacterized protein (TIGR02284 family)